MPCEGFGIQVRNGKTLVFPETEESPFEKIGSQPGSSLTNCGPSYRNGNSSIPLVMWLPLHLALGPSPAPYAKGTRRSHAHLSIR